MKNPHPNTIAGIGLILTVASIIFYREHPTIFAIILACALGADLVAKIMRQSKKYSNEPSLKLADWTSDRLGEAVLFSVFWFPWLFLFIINCFLTLYSFLRKETIILPLRQTFLAYFVVFNIFGAKLF